MALTGKQYEAFYSTSGGGADDASASLAKAEELWDHYRTKGMKRFMRHPELSALVFQLQQMQDEITYLRTEISANKDKATFPGLGTSGSTALAGDTTTISSSQASAIAANTAKTGITLQEQKDIANTKVEASTNTSEISKSNTNISTNTNAVATSIRVGAYPALPPLAPAGTTQSHGSEIVYDKLQNKYFLNIYYVEITPGKGGKNQRVVRTGQIELT